MNYRPCVDCRVAISGQFPANKQAITGRNRPTSPAYPPAAAPLPGAPREVRACIRLSTTGNSIPPARKGRAQDQILAELRGLGRDDRDMLRVTADLNDRDDTAINDRFKGENREVLEHMRHAECDACSAVEHRLGDHDRELREQQK